MPKTLIAVGLYVSDAEPIALRYAERLSLHRVFSSAVEMDGEVSRCIVMAGSDKPPWVAVFSGSGHCAAANVLSERPPGLHQLVYFTDEYAADVQWLRRRDQGYQSVVPLRGTRYLRRVSATLAELGLIVDLVERPPRELDEDAWRSALFDALARGQYARSDASARNLPRRQLERGPEQQLPSLALPADESAPVWVSRIAGHAWSARCGSVRDGALVPELGALLAGVAERGVPRYRADVAAATHCLVAQGIGSRPGESTGGAFPWIDSPVFLSRGSAEAIRTGACQRAAALASWLRDVAGDEPTPVPETVLASNPFAHGRDLWAPSAAMVQYLAEVVVDARTGDLVLINEKIDAGRCGFATLHRIREATALAHAATLTNLEAAPADDVVETWRATLRDLAGGPYRAALAFEREPPPFDLPDWEDRLLAGSLDIPLLDHGELDVRADGVYRRAGETDERIDILLLRRPASLAQFQPLAQLAHAGKLVIIEPVLGSLANDKAIRGFSDRLVERYRGERPVLRAPRGLTLMDPATRREVFEHPGEFLFKERGGAAGRRIWVGDELPPDALVRLHNNVEDDPTRWVAQERIRARTALFVSADDGGLRVWEASYVLQVYVLVSNHLRCPLAFAATVSSSRGAKVRGLDQTHIADVVVSSHGI